jgi:hypothetical protein
VSWREAVAKALMGAERTDLPTDAFHGTKHQFDAFRYTKNEGTIDQQLGPHFAKDPMIANSFTQGYGYADPLDPRNIKEGSHVIPARIPSESEMYRVPQVTYPETGAVQSDGRAIANAAAIEAYKRQPTMLQSWLTLMHGIPPSDVDRISEDLLAGRRVPVRSDGSDASLIEHLNNYGLGFIDDTNITALARKSWQDQGYRGLIYQNTAPMEIRNASDPTSYIVFDPKDIRSRFAAFGSDPDSMASSNLMRGAVAAPTATLGGLAAQDQYQPQPAEPPQ